MRYFFCTSSKTTGRPSALRTLPSEYIVPHTKMASWPPGWVVEEWVVEEQKEQERTHRRFSHVPMVRCMLRVSVRTGSVYSFSIRTSYMQRVLFFNQNGHWQPTPERRHHAPSAARASNCRNATASSTSTTRKSSGGRANQLLLLLLLLSLLAASTSRSSSATRAGPATALRFLDATKWTCLACKRATQAQT
jgi:hypothetical protein